jgi:RNA polymerase sigma factor (sigma-70 family)
MQSPAPHLPFAFPMTETALDRLLAQRQQFLSFVERRVSDSALAEDIVQTAYLRAIEHRDEFKPSESVVAWFYRLLRNALIDNYRRHASKQKALEALTRELTRELEASAQPDLRSEVCACLHAVLDGLKPEYSEALRAIDLGEQRVRDFARQHSLTASTTAVRLHRARAALRKQLLRTCATCAEHACVDCTCKKHPVPARSPRQ